MLKRILLTSMLIGMVSITGFSQARKNLSVLAYYMGGPEKIDSLPAEKLTHIIYSFCHLQGNRLKVDNGRDSLTITKLVQLKKRNPKLKIILSLGGWGGCQTCSDVFSTSKDRIAFALSVLELNNQFHTDGLDLDWEYPSIEGYPGHAFKPADKANFTELVKLLRQLFGTTFELSFAAGGFDKFIDHSVDWAAVMPYVDRVNLMTYDLVNGYSKETGHHTALYSNPKQKESTNNCVQRLIKLGVPSQKLVIGAAFYARVWEGVPATANGLYQSGKFKRGINFNDFEKELAGFSFFWDEVSMAPWAYHPEKKLFATFDDKRSIALKTKYAVDQHLNGIMFWEISGDKQNNGLVDEINKALK